jgi:hypothetical protein
MVSPTCFGITLPFSGSVPSAFWQMLNWGAVDRILWMGALYTVTAFFCVTTQRVLAIPYQCFGTTYRSRKAGRNYNYAPRHDPQDCSSHILRGGSLKSLNFTMCLLHENRCVNYATYVNYATVDLLCTEQVCISFGSPVLVFSFLA